MIAGDRSGGAGTEGVKEGRGSVGVRGSEAGMPLLPGAGLWWSGLPAAWRSRTETREVRV